MKDFTSKLNCVYFVVLIGWIVPATAGAQEYRRKIDSLRAIWYSVPGTVPDSLRLQAGVFLASEYSNVNYDSIRIISQEMDAYGIRTGNRLWRAQANCHLGKYYYYKKENVAACTAYQCALSFSEHENAPFVVTSHLGLGRLYGEMKLADSCFYHLQYAKNLAIRYSFKQELGHVYSSLGIFSYKLEGKYIDALDYFTEAIKSKPPKRQVKDFIQMSTVFSILGLNEEANACLKKGLTITAKDSTPAETIIIYSASIKLRPTLREMDQMLQKGKTLGDQYQLSLPLFGLYVSAIDAYLDSLQLDKAALCIQEAQKLISSTSVSSNNLLKLLLAILNHHQRHYKQSLDICLKIRPVLEQANDQELLLGLYSTMSQSYEAIGQTGKALYYERKREAMEQLLNNRRLVTEALSTYVRKLTENERIALQLSKENAERLATASKSRERLTFWLFCLISLWLSGVAISYFVFYRQKLRSAERMTQANNELAVEKEKLQRSNSRLQRFSSVVSHDILSNLDLILSTGHVMVGKQPKPERLAQYYQMAQQTSAQLKTYCLGLLKEARQAHHTTELEDPNPTLQSVYRQFEPVLRTKQFQVKLDVLPPSPLPPAVVAQLFQNLISNVLRHAGTQANPSLHIGSGKDAAGNDYWLVADNGPGVPESERTAIFNGENREDGGTGQHVGLSLLKQTLLEYGSGIRVAERPGGGAQFMIAFDAVAQSLPEPARRFANAF